MPRIALDDPRLYINRHVAWLGFNRRVLEEALDAGNPLLERVKFLAITIALALGATAALDGLNKLQIALP